jgi:GTP diphosphokinase / guanosine-3',5'-bis(diphosphate) 3'-diphosphatase
MMTPHVGMLARATSLAIRAHEGQIRQGGRPFIHHPVRVCEIVAMHRGSGDATVAAMLHDVLEDSAVTRAEIEAVTSEQIGWIVSEVTDPAEFAKMPRRERKIAQAEKYQGADYEVQLVKLGDQTDNLESLKEALKAGRKKWVSEYAEGAMLVASACRASSPELFARALRAYEDTQERLAHMEPLPTP